MNTVTWNLYLLDDDQKRHKLMPALINAANAKAEKCDASHRFQCGFVDGKPVLDAERLNRALEDPSGIWLIDLNIPQASGVGPVNKIGHFRSAVARPEVELATAMLGRLAAYRRPFRIVSSGSLPEAVAKEILTSLDMKSSLFESSLHVPLMADELFGLVVPDQHYAQAFKDAIGILDERKYHGQVNHGACVTMFERNLAHNIEDWDLRYPAGQTRLPKLEVETLETVIRTLFEVLDLDLGALNRYPIKSRRDYWYLPAAKAIHSDLLHRTFLIGLPARNVSKQFEPSARRAIRARDIRTQPVHSGFLALQCLTKPRAKNDGFSLDELSEWSDRDAFGISLALSARWEGLSGIDVFKDVLSGVWQPLPDKPNRRELACALKTVCDTFVTEGSAVAVNNGRLTLTLAIRETPLS